jgi:hypothetical protein
MPAHGSLLVYSTRSEWKREAVSLGCRDNRQGTNKVATSPGTRAYALVNHLCLFGVHIISPRKVR